MSTPKLHTTLKNFHDLSAPELRKHWQEAMAQIDACDDTFDKLKLMEELVMKVNRNQKPFLEGMLDDMRSKEAERLSKLPQRQTMPDSTATSSADHATVNGEQADDTLRRTRSCERCDTELAYRENEQPSGSFCSNPIKFCEKCLKKICKERFAKKK